MTIQDLKLDIKKNLDYYNQEFKDKSATDLLSWSLNTFKEKITLASSLGLEDQVLTEISVRINPDIKIFFLDTGRIHQETYDLLEESIEMYNIKYNIYFPDTKAIEEFERENGPNPFFKSLELRKKCCQIRKIEPLNRALKNNEAWITGLRREQSVTRANINKIEWDEINNLIKINPLMDWTEGDVLNYILDNQIPYNKLFDQGYTSVGCAPCTRIIKLGQDKRAGRWWWESPEKRECGLHQKH
jgi:phosphoadenosine phosphosulfate reductase